MESERKQNMKDIDLKQIESPMAKKLQIEVKTGTLKSKTQRKKRIWFNGDGELVELSE